MGAQAKRRTPHCIIPVAKSTEYQKTHERILLAVNWLIGGSKEPGRR